MKYSDKKIEDAIAIAIKLGLSCSQTELEIFKMSLRDIGSAVASEIRDEINMLTHEQSIKYQIQR